MIVRNPLLYKRPVCAEYEKKIRKQTIEIFGKNKKRIENKSSKKMGNKTSLKSTLFLINHTECNTVYINDGQQL